MTEWSETYRGSVAPWECDVTEHFTIAYYYERLDQAAANLADELGLSERLRGGIMPRRVDARFVRELRAGAGFHIESAVIGVDDNELRLGHRIADSANGETVTWIAERWAPVAPESRAAIAARIAAWPGPEVEERPEPTQTTGLAPTAAGRVRPGDLDEHGGFTLGAFIHCFTAASLQMQAAIGMDAAYMNAQRRGFSTFELGLRVARLPRLGERYRIQSGVAHLVSSSLRFHHRLSNAGTGEVLVTLGQFGVQLDLDARRPAALPDALRTRAAQLLLAAG